MLESGTLNPSSIAAERRVRKTQTMNPSPLVPSHPASTGPLPRRRRGNGFLALGVYGVLTGVLLAAPVRAEPDPNATSVSHPERASVSGPSRYAWLRGESRASRSASSEGWWPGMAAIALILAICGGITVVARRFAPRSAAGAVHVVGRVSLSPRHSVYLLRVGRKVLLVGAGPQGPPSLISELDDVPDSPPGVRQEDGA